MGTALAPRGDLAIKEVRTPVATQRIEVPFPANGRRSLPTDLGPRGPPFRPSERQTLGARRPVLWNRALMGSDKRTVIFAFAGAQHGIRN